MKKERVLSLPLPLRSSLLPLPLLCLFLGLISLPFLFLCVSLMLLSLGLILTYSNLVTIKFVVEKVINYSGVISPQAKHIDPEMAMSQLVNPKAGFRHSDNFPLGILNLCWLF